MTKSTFIETVEAQRKDDIYWVIPVLYQSLKGSIVLNDGVYLSVICKN